MEEAIKGLIKDYEKRIEIIKGLIEDDKKKTLELLEDTHETVIVFELPTALFRLTADCQKLIALKRMLTDLKEAK